MGYYWELLKSESKKDKEFGIFGVLGKWLLFGGPQRQPGKPQKTIWFRTLWFFTIVPALLVVLALLACSGNIFALKPEVQKYIYYSCGLLVLDAILWYLRAKDLKKKTDKQSMDADESLPEENNDEDIDDNDDFENDDVVINDEKEIDDIDNDEEIDEDEEIDDLDEDDDDKTR